MAGFKQFADTEAWQVGRVLTNAIYGLTRREPFANCVDRCVGHQSHHRWSQPHLRSSKRT